MVKLVGSMLWDDDRDGGELNCSSMREPVPNR